MEPVQHGGGSIFDARIHPRGRRCRIDRGRREALPRFNPFAAAALLLYLTAGGAAASETPPGVEQLLPRGAIAAITRPTFVPAVAAEIPDDAWVLGVAIDGEARAYSLNLLNRHEVVNDRVGEKSFAAVW